MPFTPFHWGPALLIGLLFFPLFNIPALLISSVIIDVEGITLLLTRAPYLHGFFHSYPGASIVGVALVFTLYPVRRHMDRLTEAFRLKQRSTLKNMVPASFFGVYSHVFLDSFLYPEMMPFYPSQANPLLDLVSSDAVYIVCTLSFLPAVLLYVARLIMKRG